MRNQSLQIKSFIPLLFISTAILPPAAHAYAGPGVTLGAILVFLTVVFAFFSSTFLSIFNFIKKIYIKINSSKNKDKRKKQENLNESQGSYRK